MPFLKDAQVVHMEEDTLTYRTRGGVHVSFFSDLKLGRLGRPSMDDRGILMMASPLDLLATKCKVLLQRVEAKDYRDIAALLTSGLTLRQGIEGAMGIFGEAFPPFDAMRAMTWFEGGDLSSLGEKERRILERSTEELLREVMDMPLVPATIVSKSLSPRTSSDAHAPTEREIRALGLVEDPIEPPS
ncbi:MAG: hypothetical protein IJR14_00085 [Synergistaceae bacterium]|nr:hypothetical protein [Synergistaceae bacterium]